MRSFFEKINVEFLIPVSDLVNIGAAQQFADRVRGFSFQVLNFCSEVGLESSSNAVTATPIPAPFL
jgi:hypothetical protein